MDGEAPLHAGSDTPAGDTGSRHSELQLARLGRTVASIHKLFWGRGPMQARASVIDDVAVVVLEGCLTTRERALCRHGHRDDVISDRSVMDAAMDAQLRHAVEHTLGRVVETVLSAFDARNDVLAETFVLRPPEPLDSLETRARDARTQNHRVLEEHRALRAEQRQARRRLVACGARPPRPWLPSGG